MKNQKEKEEILAYWNSKKIIVHRRLNHDLDVELGRTLQYYSLEEIKEIIDFYATILEPEVAEDDKKYFWTYRWNLYEFLKRGIKKFDGQQPSNYLRKQNVTAPTAIIFKRK